MTNQGKNFLNDDNFDESIPLQIGKERTTESYKEKMNEDIETIDTSENRTVVQRTKWRPIYEVLDQYYINNSHIFPADFIIKCKQFPNEPQTISGVVKNNMKCMVKKKVYMHRLSSFGERTCYLMQQIRIKQIKI